MFMYKLLKITRIMTMTSTWTHEFFIEIVNDIRGYYEKGNL